MKVVPPEDMQGKLSNVLDYAPDYAAALGRLLSHWNHLERLLIHILSYLLSINWHKAVMVYEEFVSTKSKITLLRRLNHHFNDDEVIKKELDGYLAEALKLNTKRNTFIHSSWAGNVKDLRIRKNIPPPNYKKTSRGQIDKPNLQKIQDVVQEISKLSLSFYDVIYRVSWSRLELPQE